jgi:hypothetical protein
MSESENIGTLLIKEGKLTHEQLTEVLEYQCRLASSQMMSLEEILLSFEYATEADVQALKGTQSQTIAAPEPSSYFQDFGLPAEEKPLAMSSRKKLGQILIEERWLDDWQLTHALLSQKEPGNQNKQIGKILVEMGYLGQEKLSRALSIQLSGVSVDKGPLIAAKLPAPKLGELLIKAGVIQEWQLLHALTLQKENTDKKTGLGTILVRLGYAPKEAVAKVLDLQPKEN